jgi:hypothetical protein
MRLRIDNSESVETFFENSRLMGIVAPVRQYQFCWLLNQRLKFDFRTYHDLEIQLEKKKRKYFFTIFNHNEPMVSLQHLLYQNTCDGEHLLPEFKHLDYLWMIRGELIPDVAFHSLMASIRAIQGVQMVTEITDEMIRNKSHLIL